ncbi:MAG: TonB-dependent receptor [Betaproteobacteria bacterium]|nr:TonB-dependent receptor [Betaproteobacteria bacterium]
MSINARLTRHWLAGMASSARIACRPISATTTIRSSVTKTTWRACLWLSPEPELARQSGYGTAFKAPTFNDLYYPLTHGSYGNPNLKPEESRNREVSLPFERVYPRLTITFPPDRLDFSMT